MNNFLNPIGTGQLFPNALTNNDFSFVPPPPGRLGPSVPDAEGYDSNDTEQPPQNQPQIVDLSKMAGSGYEGCYWFRIPLNYNNYGYKQVGKYTRTNGKRADGALQSEMVQVLCLPPITVDQGSSTPPGTGIDRITSAEFAGVEVFTGYEVGVAELYRETSTTDATVIAVAGFTSPGPTGINAIRTIVVGGVTYLALCYQTPGGGANMIQVISDLANPPTSSTIPVGTLPVFDILQTPIDGNAILVYNLGGSAGMGAISAIRTDVAVGTAALSTPRCIINGGGYIVGIVDAEEGGPNVYIVEPINGTHIQFNNTGVGITSQARLIKTDARGYLPVVVDVPLRWVTFCTEWRGGVVCCDQFTHWYLNKRNPRGKWRRMPVTDEFPANSGVLYKCGGHHQKDGKFIINMNEVAVSSGNTNCYGVEFDYEKWSATKIETTFLTNAAAGVMGTRGGMRLPWSPYTNYRHNRAVTTKWIRQQTFPLGSDLFSLRHTTGSPAGTGIETTPEDSITFPVMDIDGLEDCVKTVTAISGPKSAAVAEGGTDAYVLVEELLSNRTGTGPNGNGAQFFGTEPAQRVQKREYDTPAWTYQMQFKITIHRATSGTDATRMNINAFNNQIFIEGIAVRDPVAALPAQVYKSMDTQKLKPAS